MIVEEAAFPKFHQLTHGQRIRKSQTRRHKTLGQETHLTLRGEIEGTMNMPSELKKYDKTHIPHEVYSILNETQ